jgi:hypothetical protein
VFAKLLGDAAAWPAAAPRRDDRRPAGIWRTTPLERVPVSVCMVCGRAGHTASTCPRCEFCDQRGHTAGECPTRPDESWPEDHRGDAIPDVA